MLHASTELIGSQAKCGFTPQIFLAIGTIAGMIEEAQTRVEH